MKNINLTKYGFRRCTNQDFSDDGNKFTCFMVGERITVNKLVDHDAVYISARLDGGDLFYEEYSILPHFKDLYVLNGTSKEKLTEQDLINFYNNCLAFEQEYKEAESKIVYPTLEEMEAQCQKIVDLRQSELDTIVSLLKEVSVKFILNASDTRIKLFKKHYESLTNKIIWDTTKYAKCYYETLWGRSFVKNINIDLKPSWQYKEMLEMLNKYKEE